MANALATTRKKRLRQIEQRLRQLGGTAARTFWEYGLLFTEVKTGELWREDGATSFVAWAEAHGVDRETARKTMTIAAQFSAEAAERYGQEKLFAAVALLEATPHEEQPGDLSALQVRFRNDEGQFESVPFPKATVAQVKSAAKVATKRPTAPKIPESHQQWAASLEDKLGEGGSARVRLSVDSDGQTRVSVSVSLAEWEAFLAAAGTVGAAPKGS